MGEEGRSSVGGTGEEGPWCPGVSARATLQTMTPLQTHRHVWIRGLCSPKAHKSHRQIATIPIQEVRSHHSMKNRHALCSPGLDIHHHPGGLSVATSPHAKRYLVHDCGHQSCTADSRTRPISTGNRLQTQPRLNKQALLPALRLGGDSSITRLVNLDFMASSVRTEGLVHLF